MKHIAQILRSKADQRVHGIAPSTSVRDAVRQMMELNVGALLVLEGDDVVGIVSERDCAWSMVLAGRSPEGMAVREIMSAPVQYVRPSHTNEECMALMTDKRLRHLPVIEEGRLVGLVSIGDLVKDIISEQSFIIQQLEHYIAGDRGV
jgi:CBS domain-containing protein